MAENNNGRDGRGFAGMDPEKQRKIASMGGKAAHEKGTAHEFDSQEAQEAGAKGGKASHSKDSNNPRDSNFEQDGSLTDDD